MKTLSASAALAGLLLVASSGLAAAVDPSPSMAPGASATGTVVENCGVTSDYPTVPDRVLLGAPGIIATLDALGVADAAIGYTLSDYRVEGIEAYPNLTLTTPDYTPSREFLVSAQPDLYLVNDEGQILGEGAASRSDLAGIPANLYVLGGYCASGPAPTTIEVVYGDLAHLGAIFGIEETAARVVGELRDRVAAARASREGQGPWTAASVTVWDGKVYANSGASYAAVIDALGMTNAFAELGANWAEISAEDVVASDADVLFVAFSGGDAERDQALAEARSLFANAPAVTGERVFAWDSSWFEAGGVRIVDVIEQSARDVFGG